MGIGFLVIVYFLPKGVVGRIEQLLARRGARHGSNGAQRGECDQAFGGLVAVNNLSFEVHQNEVMGIIGLNGSGKTTMMN